MDNLQLSWKLLTTICLSVYLWASGWHRNNNTPFETIVASIVNLWKIYTINVCLIKCGSTDSELIHAKIMLWQEICWKKKQINLNIERSESEII